MEHSALSIFLKYAADWRKVFLFRIPECSLSFAKIMQTSGKKACFQFPECSLSYAKIMQGECSSKFWKRSFIRLAIAEPKLILCKDNISDLHSQKYESKNESLPFWLSLFKIILSSWKQNQRQTAWLTKPHDADSGKTKADDGKDTDRRSARTRHATNW